VNISLLHGIYVGQGKAPKASEWHNIVDNVVEREFMFGLAQGVMGESTFLIELVGEVEREIWWYPLGF
jgi:hypothetical protein